MQNEEKSNLEERILAHFDGSADHASSKALLDEVMASPEKRALFRAHETLNSVIAAARVPMEAPLETKRQIADRIPGLLAFIPGLLGTTETMPILTQSANPFIEFFTRMSFSTAVSIGGAIAVLTTAGVIVKNNLDHNAAQTQKIALVQNASPIPRDRGMRQASTNSASPNYAMVAPNTVSENASSAISHRASATLRANAKPIPSSISNAHQPSAISQNNASQNEDNAPLVMNAFTTPRHAPAIASNIPIMQTGILTPMPEEASEAITVRPYASTGTRFVQLNGYKDNTIKGNQSSIVGLEFDLGDRYAFRAQGGYSSFAQVVPSPIGTFNSLLGTSTVYGPGMALFPEYWTTLGISYSFVLTPSLPLIVSADAGAVWFTNPGIMTMAGIGTEIPVGSQLAIRPLLTFDAVRTSTSLASPLPNNAIYESVNTPTMWASSFGFQLNFVYRP